MSDRPYLTPHQWPSMVPPRVTWGDKQFELTPAMAATWAEILTNYIASSIREVERMRGK